MSSQPLDLLHLILSDVWQASRIPVDVMFGSSPVIDTSPSVYATTLKQSLTTAYNHVRDKMNVTFEQQKQ